MRLSALVALLLVVIGIAVWLFWPKPPAPAAPGEDEGGAAGLIAEVRPARAAAARQDAGKVPAAGDDDGGDVAEADVPAKDELPPDGGYYTNRKGQVCLYRPDKSAYTNGVEQLLNMAIPSTEGAAVPPLPIISGDDAKELERALKHKLAVAEGDDEATIERKMLITQGKLELDEQRQEGGLTVSEYVNALRDQYNDNADFASEARKIDQQIYDDESMTDEDYLKAREQINAKLKERGLPELEPRE